MAVSQQTFLATAGQWVPLCEWREKREALMVCVSAGSAILSITTSAPIVTSISGQDPAGMLCSPSVGNGPSIFRLSKALDGDLVAQEWFAWPIGTTPAPITVVDIVDGPLFPGPGWIFLVNFITGAGVMVALVSSVCAGGARPAVSTGLQGPLLPLGGVGTPPQGGNTGLQSIYMWTHPGGPDTLSVSSAIDGFAQVGLYSIPTATILDGADNNQGTGNPINCTATTPISGVLAVTIGYSLGVSIANDDTVWPIGWLPILDGGLNNIAGFDWGWQAQYKISNLAETPDFSYDSPTPPGDWATWLMSLDLVAAQTAITVLESFEVPALDDPDHQDHAHKITVQLPRLSRKGAMALKDLLTRVDPDQEQTDETTDRTEHDNPDTDDSGL